jgi:undecaprenyl-diphosphatase
VSRSLVTILAATALGLAVPAAVEFSFLLGFVTLGGATAYETLSSGQDMVDAYGLAVPLLGLAVAFVSAIVAMRWMVGYLERHGLELFGWYRIGAAAVLAVLLLSGAV